MKSPVEDAVTALNAEDAQTDAFQKRLVDLDFFVLDNSLRESTVAQLRGHTLENKQRIYNTVKKLNVHGIVVAAFSSMHRVDDEFCKWLDDEGEDKSNLWSFSDVFYKFGADGTPISGLPDHLPDGLRKMRQYNLYNVIFELDLNSHDHLDWDKTWGVEQTCALMEELVTFVYTYLNDDAKILINFRDLPSAMQHHPTRVLRVVEHFASMPEERRIFGLVYEDPMGSVLPLRLGSWTRAIRSVMDAHGWHDGKLLNHVHQKWDLQTAGTLECLAAGGNGMWASVCTEGAFMGHACTTVTLTNLIRLGNKSVLDSMNCKEFRQAAIDVTEYTTDHPPHPRHVVYGARALDLVFDFVGLGDFNLPEFFGKRAINRITTLASPQMIRNRLKHLFDLNDNLDEDSESNTNADAGDDGADTPLMKIATRMKEMMLEDLRAGRKEEYHSPMGLAILFDRCGGQLTPKMADEIAGIELESEHHKRIVEAIKAEWDAWDSKEECSGDDKLEFNSFYHGFMQPYFGCYACPEVKAAFKSIDFDADGFVDWKEFLLYVKWALREYPDTANADEVISIAFEKGIIPGMLDRKV